MKYLHENIKSFPMQIDYFRTRMKARLHALEMMYPSNSKPKDLLESQEFASWLAMLLRETIEMLQYCHEDVEKEYHSILMNVEVVIGICFKFIEWSKYGTVDTVGFTQKPAGDSFAVDVPSLNDITEVIDVLKGITAAFAKYESYGVEADGTVSLKSMNAHNCRKTAMMSRLFIFYKLLPMADDQPEARSAIAKTFKLFAKQYIELTSCVTDLLSYVPLLTKEDREAILVELAGVVDSKSDNPLRQGRAQITLAKFQYIFRDSQFANLDDLKAFVAPLVDQYFELCKLDEKPEKGERKMADEMVLLVATIIDNYVGDLVKQGNVETMQERINLDLFKVSLLELAYESSGYNFDMQLSLLRSFDRLGASSSYSESYNDLGIKGVQLETLGFLWVRHAMRWLGFSQFNSTMVKYQRYLAHNADDLGSNKRKAIEDMNYEQLENFV